MNKFKSTGNKIINTSERIKNSIANAVPSTGFTFLSMPELLKWSEKITESAASIYDKAMDSRYIKSSSSLGGKNHRMFDGGHDLIGAWEKVKDASKEDSFIEEVNAYFVAIMKDLSTTKGLPFTSLDYNNYNAWAENVSNLNIPGLDKAYLYDLLSFDALEVLNSSIGIVALVFAMNKKDKERFSQFVGSLGVVSITSANPIMSILIAVVAGYAYKKRQMEISKTEALKGATLTTSSILVFTMFSLPLLIELVFALVLSSLIKDFAFGKKSAAKLVRAHYLKMKNLMSQKKTA